MPAIESATTYQGLIDEATKLLYDSSDSPRIDSEVLLQHAIGKPLAWLIAYGDKIATKQHLVDLLSACRVTSAWSANSLYYWP